MKIRLNNISLVKICLSFLFFLCFFEFDYFFYELVRFLAMIGFGILAFDVRNNKNKKWLVVWLSSLLLVNPYIKITLDRETWIAIDVIWIILLLTSEKKFLYYIFDFYDLIKSDLNKKNNSLSKKSEPIPKKTAHRFNYPNGHPLKKDQKKELTSNNSLTSQQKQDYSNFSKRDFSETQTNIKKEEILERLYELGTITKEEFEKKKNKLKAKNFESEKVKYDLSESVSDFILNIKEEIKIRLDDLKNAAYYEIFSKKEFDKKVIEIINEGAKSVMKNIGIKLVLKDRVKNVKSGEALGIRNYKYGDAFGEFKEPKLIDSFGIVSGISLRNLNQTSVVNRQKEWIDVTLSLNGNYKVFKSTDCIEHNKLYIDKSSEKDIQNVENFYLDDSSLNYILKILNI